jgi:5-methylcytosine-specific restriction endonuclease McrA
MRCCICGKKVAENDLSFDHSLPISLGGPHSQENQRVSHWLCNNRRGAGWLPVQMVLL